MSAAPDFISPFVGWKGLMANAEGRLWSPMESEFEWVGGTRAEAICRRGGHVPGSAGCSCGIYAVKTLEDLIGTGYNWSPTEEFRDRGEVVHVIVKLKLWGQIRKASTGYRAQYAYPEKVYLPGWRIKGYSKAIRERYGCRIGVIDRFTGRTLDRKEP